MYELKIYRGVISHGNENRCKTGRGIGFSYQNWLEYFVEFWPEHSKISKTCILMGYLWPKYVMFELKKYRGVMFDGTEHWCKIWRKTDLSFLKWHEEFVKFFQKSRNWDFDGIVLSKIRKCMGLKFTGELFVMTMKKDAKLEEEFTCHFRIDMRTLMSFDWSTWKSQKFAPLMGCIWPKYITFELKKYRRVMFDATEYWCKIWRKTDFCFQK